MNNDKQVNGRVHKAFDNATPYVYEDIKRDCPSRQTTATKRRTNYWKWATFAMAFVLLAVGVLSAVNLVGGNNAMACETVVSMDVNPSLQINVNAQGKVIEVVANNEDAKKIVGTMDFSGSSLEVTVYALVGSMYANGYLSQVSNSVLVDVDTKGDKTKIVADLTTQITGALKNNGVNPNVIVSKSVDELTAEEQQQAEEVLNSFDISVAKARLIAQIMQNDATGKHDITSLVALKVNDLSLILEGLVGSSIGSGTTSEGAYIGKEAAQAAAFKAFGITDEQASNVQNMRIKLDYEDGRMVYEVEFVLDGKKYECEVVAGKAISDKNIVYEMEVELVGGKPQKTTLTQAEKELLRANIVSQVLVDVDVDIADTISVKAKIENGMDFDDDDYTVEVEFVYNNIEYEFEFDYSGKMLKSKFKYIGGKNEDAQVDADKLNQLLKDRWTRLFGSFDVDLDGIQWHFEYDDGVIECETEIRIGKSTYSVEIKIDKVTGGLVDIEIDID